MQATWNLKVQCCEQMDLVPDRDYQLRMTCVNCGTTSCPCSKPELGFVCMLPAEDYGEHLNTAAELTRAALDNRQLMVAAIGSMEAQAIKHGPWYGGPVSYATKAACALLRDSWKIVLGAVLYAGYLRIS